MKKKQLIVSMLAFCVVIVGLVLGLKLQYDTATSDWNNRKEPLNIKIEALKEAILSREDITDDEKSTLINEMYKDGVTDYFKYCKKYEEKTGNPAVDTVANLKFIRYHGIIIDNIIETTNKLNDFYDNLDDYVKDIHNQDN